jgi:pimeloyl-ACP methyl ester carboxylesterase
MIVLDDPASRLEVVMEAPTLRSLAAKDGTKLIADVWNVNEDSTLLLLPAAAETRSVWHPVVDHFPPDTKSRWRFVAADHRGHGDSGRSESYLFKDFTDELLTWIGQLSARPIGCRRRFDRGRTGDGRCG